MGAKPITGTNLLWFIMEQIKDVKEEIRKDVNEYIRQSEKLDGNKSFKKTYDVDKDFCYLVEMNGSKMKLALLVNGKPLTEATIGDMSDFDFVWDMFLKKSASLNYRSLGVFIDSFKEKMNEFIEDDEVFEPFIVKSNGNDNKEMMIDITAKTGFYAFYFLFGYSYGFTLSELFVDFNFPQLDEINEQYGTVILRHRDDERMTFAFNPTSRLGRLITHKVRHYMEVS